MREEEGRPKKCGLPQSTRVGYGQVVGDVLTVTISVMAATARQHKIVWPHSRLAEVYMHLCPENF